MIDLKYYMTGKWEVVMSSKDVCSLGWEVLYNICTIKCVMVRLTQKDQTCNYNITKKSILLAKYQCNHVIFRQIQKKKIHICGCKDFKLGPKRRGELQKYFLAKRSLNWTLGTHSLLIWTFKKNPLRKGSTFQFILNKHEKVSCKISKKAANLI